MSELRTDFKDEILQEGETHRVYDIKRKGTDEIVESDIYLEKAYTPLQEGNEFGAKEVNEIHGRLNGLAPQNLLINGDFQINQRGLGEYTSSGYTLDMWRCYLISGNKVSPISGGGIKIEKVGGTFSLRQKVPFTENDIGKKYTVSFELETDTLIESDLNFGQQTNILNFEVGKKVYSRTFTLQSNDIVNGYVDLIIVNIGEVVGNINVYYCDLFEGDIAYPHVKEDDAIALMRCRSKLKVFKANEWIGLAEVVSTAYATIFVDLSELDNVPTVKWDDLTVYQSGEIYKEVISVDMNTNRFGNMVGLTLNTESGLNADMRVGKVFLSSNGYLEFSAEPL